MAQSAYYHSLDTQPGFWQGMANIFNAPATYQQAKQEREYRLQQLQLERDRFLADMEDRQARRAYETQNLELERQRHAASSDFMRAQAASMTSGSALAASKEQREAAQQRRENLRAGLLAPPTDQPLPYGLQTFGRAMGITGWPARDDRAAIQAGIDERARAAQEAEDNRRVKLAGIQERADAAYAATLAAVQERRARIIQGMVKEELGLRGQLEGGTLPPARLEAIRQYVEKQIPDPVRPGAAGGPTTGGRAYGDDPPPVDDPWGALLQPR